MKKIVFASSNNHKFNEVKDLFKDTGIEIIQPPQGFDPDETGLTFQENSYIKAKEAALLTGMVAFADDTGLEIEALDGRPGIYSARYAETDELKIEKILDELKNISKEKRQAKFTCSMSVVAPAGEKLFETLGVCEGFIVKEVSGTNGFGYDPIFLVSELNKTMAELTMDEKNQVSHRARAFKQLLQWIETQD